MSFKPDLLRELDIPQFEDAETARRWLENQVWPEHSVCVHCGEVERTYSLNGRTTRPGLYSCGGCKGQFTVTTKTVFHGTKIGLHKWLQLTAALEKTPATVAEIGDAFDITYKTAWRMRGIIRPGMDLRAQKGRGTLPREQMVYPFLPKAQQGNRDHELLLMINEAVPRNIPEDRRADICQELALAILIGEADTRNLSKAAKAAFSKVYAMHPTMWGPLSLDAPIGDGTFSLIDTLSEEDSIWNKI